MKEKASKDMKLTFGKHKNEHLEECPESYIFWLSRHEKVLAPDNRKFAREAKKLMEKYQVGQMVKVVRASIGCATVVAEVTKVEGDVIHAKLHKTGISYQYSPNSIVPATEKDIKNAAAWRKWEEGQRNHQPLAPISIPPDFGLLDEDGVRIA